MAYKIRLPGLAGAIFNDRVTWEPVVPPDLYTSKLPPVAPDGTVACGGCGQRFPFAAVNIGDESYVCNRCLKGRAANAANAMERNTVSLRSRSWIAPVIGAAVFAVVIAIIVAAS